MFQFYKQIHFFGRARINIYKHFPSELKLVHFFPAVFTLGIISVLLLNIFYPPLAYLGNIFLLVYFMLIFFHSLVLNKSLKVAFLSIISSFIQLTAYGLGFIQDFFKRIVLKKQ
jgi:hypothetical protein